MAFKKGDPKPEGSGIKKGQSRKATNTLRDMVFGALEAKGGQAWLENLMIENPAAYATLLGKFVPKDVNVGGQQDNPVTHNVTLDGAKDWLSSMVSSINAAK